MKKKTRISFHTEKKKSKVLPITFLVIGLFTSSLVVWVGMHDWNVDRTLNSIGIEASFTEKVKTTSSEKVKESETNPESVKEIPQEPSIPRTEYIEGQVLPQEPTYLKGILLANKQYPLPSTFAPGESSEAREAFQKMAAEAALEGFQLTAFSTYRSYDYQIDLYNRYAARDGQAEADRYSARPGYSEHQTGLAFDIGEVNNQQDWASERFGKTEAGKWIASNAHHFGFIMRYPEGRESVTGYMYESWHFRYVGEEIAQEIFEKDITLEEYLEI